MGLHERARQEAMIAAARAYAICAHGDQTYGDFPYEKHLQDVVDILSVFRASYFLDKLYPILAQVGYLHDVLEDTEITYEQLDDAFGYRITSNVSAITDPVGKNRRERKEQFTVRMQFFITQPEYVFAVIVKVADRLANVRHAVKRESEKSKYVKLYRKEYPEFKALIYPFIDSHLFVYSDVLKTWFRELDDYLIVEPVTLSASICAGSVS